MCVHSHCNSYLPPPPLQEGANINKSLTTLGKVISALAEVVCIKNKICCILQEYVDFVLDKMTIWTVPLYFRTLGQIR